MNRIRQLALISLLIFLAGCSPANGTPDGDLSGQDFTEADLSGQDWSGADLSGLTFAQANMERINLSNADLRGADLTGALLNLADLRGADLTNADLGQASINDADLSGAILVGANLYAVNMHDANLEDADLSGSDLSFADLTGAILTGANLENANLQATRLVDVDLSDAHGLTEETLMPAFRTELWRKNIRAVGEAVAPACQGEAIPEAATADQGYVPAAMVLLSESGGEHDLSFDLYDYWYPIRVETTTIVACMTDEQETLVEECGNTGIGRYQYSAYIRLVAAQSGETLATYTLEGDPPLPCWAIQDDTTRIDGQHIEPGLVVGWLHPFVSYGVGLRNLNGHTNKIWDVAWSPDGTRLASGSYDGQVIIWEAATRQPLHILEGPRSGSSHLAWSPDGALLAVGAGWGITIWDTETGELSGTLAEILYNVSGLDWSPDGELLALGTRGGQLEVWNVHTGDQEAVLHGHENTVTDVQFSPDGQRVASAGYDGRVMIQSIEAGKDLIEIVHEYPPNINGVRWPVLVNGLDWSPEGTQIMAGSYDQLVTIWDADSGEVIRSYQHPHNVLDIALSADGRFIAAALDQDDVYLWDMEDDGDAEPVAFYNSYLYGQAAGSTCLDWSPGGDVLAFGLDDGTIMLWDTSTLRQ